MSSLFLDILNKEIEIFRENNKKNVRDKISIFLFKKEQDEFISLDCEFTQIDQTSVLQIKDNKNVDLQKYYVAESKDYSVDIFFDQIYQTPLIKLVLKNVVIVGETEQPKENEHLHKMISNDPKYENILMLLKKMYFSQNFRYDFTSKLIMKTQLEDKQAKAKLLKIGKTSNYIINQVNQDEELSQNSCTSVNQNYRVIPNTNFDYKKFHISHQNTIQVDLPKKKAKVTTEKEKQNNINYYEFPNELTNSNQDDQTSYQIQETNQLHQSQVDYEAYEICLEDGKANQKRKQRHLNNFQRQIQIINIDENDDDENNYDNYDNDIMLEDQSEIDFEQLKQNGKKSEIMQNLLSMIPKNLRSEKKNKNHNQKENNKQHTNDLNVRNNSNKRGRKTKRGQKFLIKVVGEQKRKKNKKLPFRDYFIVSDDEFDVKQVYLNIRSRLINDHVQLRKNPKPLKLTPDQIKKEKLEYKLENESDENEYILID